MPSGRNLGLGFPALRVSGPLRLATRERPDGRSHGLKAFGQQSLDGWLWILLPRNGMRYFPKGNSVVS